MCVLLTQGYPPLSGGAPRRLSIGDHALVTTERSVFATKLKLPSPIERGPEHGLLHTVLRDPPPPPYLLISFGRSNSPASLVLNFDDDVVRISGHGKLFGTMIERLARRRVLQVIDLLGDIDRKSLREFQQAAAQREDFRLPASGRARARTAYDAMIARFPTLRDVTLPVLDSPEHRLMIRLAKETEDASA